MKKTQQQIIKQFLRERGEVSRNLCLSLYITRLGAIICDLNKLPGWDIRGKWTADHKDYIYKVVKAPVINKVQIINGRAVLTNNQGKLI